SWQETVYYRRDVVDLDFFNSLCDVANAPVNETPFRGRDPGEVRYVGTHGAERDFENWELTHRFAFSQNEQALQVGPIGPAFKPGWDYAWVLYADAVDQNKLIKQPVGLYIERVYDRSPFMIFDLNGDGTPGNADFQVGIPLGGD